MYIYIYTYLFLSSRRTAQGICSTWIIQIAWLQQCVPLWTHASIDKRMCSDHCRPFVILLFTPDFAGTKHIDQRSDS